MSASAVIPKIDFLVPKSLADLGFYIPDATQIPRLVVSSSAHEKAGKTHWALTAPGPVAAISFDTGTKNLVKKFIREYGKTILLKVFDAPSEVEGDKKTAAKLWDEFAKTCRLFLKEPSIRTLVVDTATEAWQLLRLARFGKLTQVMPQHYVEANADFRELVKSLYEREDLNVVWIHKVKKEYKGQKSGGDGKDSWTGKYERDGFGDMDYIADVNLTHYWEEARKVDETGNPDSRGGFTQKVFGLKVGTCRDNMVGAAGESLESRWGQGADPDYNMCDFPSLARMVFPGTPSKYWT